MNHSLAINPMWPAVQTKLVQSRFFAVLMTVSSNIIRDHYCCTIPICHIPPGKSLDIIIVVPYQYVTSHQGSHQRSLVLYHTNTSHPPREIIRYHYCCTIPICHIPSGKSLEIISVVPYQYITSPQGNHQISLLLYHTNMSHPIREVIRDHQCCTIPIHHIRSGKSLEIISVVPYQYITSPQGNHQ